jgi:sulfide dehydrogenase cytochrome subunit
LTPSLRRGAALMLATTFSLAAAAQTGAADARLLASGCAQCHGANGFGRLDGIGKADMLHKLSDFRLKPARSGIMAAHARGYTPVQLDAIAGYFAALPKP